MFLIGYWCIRLKLEYGKVYFGWGLSLLLFDGRWFRFWFDIDEVCLDIESFFKVRFGVFVDFFCFVYRGLSWWFFVLDWCVVWILGCFE